MRRAVLSLQRRIHVRLTRSTPKSIGFETPKKSALTNVAPALRTCSSSPLPSGAHRNSAIDNRKCLPGARGHASAVERLRRVHAVEELHQAQQVLRVRRVATGDPAGHGELVHILCETRKLPAAKQFVVDAIESIRARPGAEDPHREATLARLEELLAQLRDTDVPQRADTK